MPIEMTMEIKVERLKTILVAHATGTPNNARDDQEYKALRTELMADPAIKGKLPKFVHINRTLSEFWGFIKQKSPSYQGRRDYLRDEFDPLLTFLEKSSSAFPIEDSGKLLLEKVDLPHIRKAWEKGLKRIKENDIDGAITSARALIETACKHILDEMEESYSDDMDLPKLYKFTASKLNLAPGQHSEQIIKQILQGCMSAIEGLGALRNKEGDAHGKSKVTFKPVPRHAELAINLAGTLTVFLVEVNEARKAK